MDVRKTVEQMAASDIRGHCLALGGVDLTSPAGKMTMQVILAVAEIGRDILLERTHSGIARARASGKRFGRPSTFNEEQNRRCWNVLTQEQALALLPSWQTVIRLRDKAEG